MTTPPLSELLKLCGLSQREAAELLDVSPSSIDKMARDVRTTPPGVSDALRDLYVRIYNATADMLEGIDGKVRIGTDPDDIVLCTYTDDEARAHGWPAAAPLNRVTYMTAALSQWDIRIEPYSGDVWDCEDAAQKT